MLGRTRNILHPKALLAADDSLLIAHPSSGHPAKAATGRSPSMVELENTGFDIAALLASAGLGRRIIQFAPKDAFFSQGDPADSVFYLQKGRARVTVVSAAEKEATIRLLSAVAGMRLSTATAVTACTALKIWRSEMIRLMHDERGFSELFMKYLIENSMCIQADLVDQLFNSNEKRRARVLLMMAEYGEPGEPKQFIPKISQETLAEMIGTTRSRVSFFMNRFRNLGFIEYKDRIRVHKSLLNVILLDQISEQNAEIPLGLANPRSGPKADYQLQ
jgi:CRP-like cAMP-binding protein